MKKEATLKEKISENPHLVKIGNAELEIQSYKEGKCIFFGKQRCVVFDKTVREKQKTLPQTKRCRGKDTNCPFYRGTSPFIPTYDESYLLPKDESEIIAYCLANGDNVLLFGPPACLSKDTILQISRGERHSPRKYTIEDAYHRFRHIRNETTKKYAKFWNHFYPTRILSLEKGSVTGYQEIEDIVYSGIKTTYTITSSFGNELRTTKDHRFKVPKGTIGRDKEGFKKLKDLRVGDKVVMRSRRGKGKGLQKRPPERETIIGHAKYHPFAYQSHKKHYHSDGSLYKIYHYCFISKAKAVLEAKLNNISLEKYLKIINTKPQRAKKLKYLKPYLTIHHKDRDKTNNEFSNLKALTNKAHCKLHGKKEARKHLPHMRVSLQAITSIKKFGKEKTYDIIMKAPYENFVTNEFIVHNSGKTSLIKQLAAILNWGTIQFSCSEETTSSKIFGQWLVSNKEMKWADGYITTAMRNGFILLEDEADFMRPELRGEVHGIMEKEGSLTLAAIHPDTGKPFQEVITKHPSFRWISTANTTGHGDDLFAFHGTQYMNAATRDRYEIILQMKEREPEQELEILIRKTNIEKSIGTKMIEVANKCRGEIGNGMIFQFSLRRLLALAKYWEICPKETACKLTVLNYCNIVDRHTVASLFRTDLNIEIY